jgi:hypothetical protein
MLSTANEAHAVIYTGNPDLGFRVDRPADDYIDGTVDLAKVRVHHCAGGYTDYTVDDTIDPVQVNHVAIAAGNECGLTFYWDSNLDIDGYGSLGAFTVRYSEATTYVPLSTDIDPVALTPYTVVSGSMSGGSPWLMVSID